MAAKSLMLLFSFGAPGPSKVEEAPWVKTFIPLSSIFHGQPAGVCLSPSLMSFGRAEKWPSSFLQICGLQLFSCTRVITEKPCTLEIGGSLDVTQPDWHLGSLEEGVPERWRWILSQVLSSPQLCDLTLGRYFSFEPCFSHVQKWDHDAHLRDDRGPWDEVLTLRWHKAGIELIISQVPLTVDSCAWKDSSSNGKRSSYISFLMCSHFTLARRTEVHIHIINTSTWRLREGQPVPIFSSIIVLFDPALWFIASTILIIF